MVTLPAAGAVHDHQTDLPPTLPAWFGSPVSLVAPTLEPLSVAEEPLAAVALAKLSFTGAAVASSATARNRHNVASKSSRGTERMARRRRESLEMSLECTFIIWLLRQWFM